ncbi:hypothetical protein LNV23_17010 [Paucibacter sp. DJ1R-11]|uniref:ShlB/FhaC/HecB family hemolysin secretion/activation protein n=1 Tax=Paucibacter sp. DJ1R-11 TaxID=2893556 RepID=UPI0021E50791|nr:ShlB/FhaC/HecB family hemolysin secretion/activation protein [Paucibacter sp. DJ1R-11]MCV2365150.1 hypothetical protein [Paucibacter sp. DJ1R-11]
MNIHLARLRQKAWPCALTALAISTLSLLPDGAARAQVAAPVAAAVEAPSFDILEFEVEGNTVLAPEVIELAVMPFLGPQRKLGDAEAARAALEKAYQSAGFLTVFVDLPEQRIDGGVLRLKVLEGRVERLSVTGARYYDQGHIRTVVRDLAVGQVPNFNAVQTQLGALNQREERRIQPVLRPGRLPGTVEAELQVNDRLPLSGTVELNNAAAAGTEDLRMSANLRYDNLLQREHSISLTAITTPRRPEQTQVLVLSYGVPLAEGDNLNLYAVSSNSDVDSLGGTKVLGKGNTWGLRYTLNLAAGEGNSHNVSLGLDYKDLQERLQQGEAAIAKPLRYAPMQVAYSGNWLQERAQTQFNASLVFALRPVLQRLVDGCQREDGSIGLQDQFRCKRKGADGGFAIWRAELRHSQALGRWWAEHLGLDQLSGRLSGQFASQQLSSGEQFSLGGAETVRGYHEGAASGDHGLLGSLELRSVNLAPRLQRAFKSAALGELIELGLLAYIDVGSTFVIEPDAGQNLRQPLLGSGLGLRLSLRNGLSLSLDSARAHKRLSTGVTPSSSRLHLRAALRF